MVDWSIQVYMTDMILCKSDNHISSITNSHVIDAAMDRVASCLIYSMLHEKLQRNHAV